MPDYSFLPGHPYGFSDVNSTAWPPSATPPPYVIFDLDATHYGTYAGPYYLPQRVDFSVSAVSATRVLPNGTKIDKFQGYEAPKVLPRESWSWVVRRGFGHRVAKDYSSVMLGGLINIYILNMTSAGNGEVWAAQARVENFSATNDPAYGQIHTAYSAEFERLTDYTYVTLLTLA